MDNRPISEQYREAAILWVDADAAANIMEETKSAVFADMVSDLISKDIKLSINRAEVLAKSSPQWRSFVVNMVDLRKRANLHKVEMDYLRMKHSEQQSIEATYRAEARL